jgi:hypothetical protein
LLCETSQAGSSFGSKNRTELPVHQVAYQEDNEIIIESLDGTRSVGGRN